MATLGTARLSADTLEFYTQQLRNWGEAFAADGDILFYGCNLAEGQFGQSLVARIADLTGADVAASDDPTGSEALGGDWSLEVATGSIETASLSVALEGLLGGSFSIETMATSGDLTLSLDQAGNLQVTDGDVVLLVENVDSVENLNDNG